MSNRRSQPFLAFVVASRAKRDAAFAAALDGYAAFVCSACSAGWYAELAELKEWSCPDCGKATDTPARTERRFFE